MLMFMFVCGDLLVCLSTIYLDLKSRYKIIKYNRFQHFRPILVIMFRHKKVPYQLIQSSSTRRESTTSSDEPSIYTSKNLYRSKTYLLLVFYVVCVEHLTEEVY